MDELPLNNFEEHLARFTAIQKSKCSNLNAARSKQFTFKKSLSLGRNNTSLNTTLLSIENWTSASNSHDAVLRNEHQFFNVKPSNDTSSIEKPVCSKKQESIANYFSRSIDDEITVIEDDFHNSKTLSDDSYPNDLNDFDLSSSKIEFVNDPLPRETVPAPLVPKKNISNPDFMKSVVATDIDKTVNTSTLSSSLLQENQCKDFIPSQNETDYFDIKVLESSPLLKKSHFEEMSVDRIQSIMSSLNEMNRSVMNKVCVIIENDVVLRRNRHLSPLIDIRNRILERSMDAGNAMQTKSSYKPSLPFYSKLCNLEEQSIIQPCPVIETSKSFALCNSFLKDIPSKIEKQNRNALSDSSQYCHDSEKQHYCNQTREQNVKKVNDRQSSQPNGSIHSEAVETQLLDLNPEFFDISDEDCSTLLSAKDQDQTSISQTKTVIEGKFYGDQRDDGASSAFKGNNFPHSERLMEIFSNIFGLRKFRHNQLEAINAALLNEDCFILMPTGGGKSLCYQLPAMVNDGVTIVISPLRSLIMDQVQKLWSLDIPANSLSGDIDASSANSVYRQLASKEIGVKLLYVTPEKISASNKLIACIENLYARKMIQRFIVDEAHCVSQWGHDFRPDYKKLKVLRENFPGVPMVALTATATPRVRFDILNQLGMKSPKWFLQSFNRPNLKYEVRPKKCKGVVEDIIALIKSKFKNMCGIVYCLSRNDCDSLAQELNGNGIGAIPYHAGLNNRNEVQELWMNDKVKVVCATIAFGMGIDKPDVRFVIHHSIPKSIEGYYQESGRAGRDGELSWCIVFYNYKDMQRIKRMVESDEANKFSWKIHMDNLFRLVQYCENKADCRRVQMLEYFGEIFDKRLCVSNLKSACDNCFSKDVFETCDMTESAKLMVKCVAQLVDERKHKNFTLLYFVDLFKGSKTQKILTAGHDKLELHGRGHAFLRADAERFARKLVLDGYLSERIFVNKMDIPISYVYLGPRAKDLLAGTGKVPFSINKKSKSSCAAAAAEPEDEELARLGDRCYAELIEVSKAVAAERHMHYTNVVNVKALRQMARELPMSEEDMLRIPHVTRAVYEKYGAKFLEVTERYGVERCVIDTEREDKQMLLTFVDDNIDSWSNEEPVEVSSSTAKKSVKRKKSTRKGSGSQKRFKFNNFKRKPQKEKGKAVKDKPVKSSHFGGSKANLWQQAPTSSARAPGFLPPPQPKRSFLRPIFEAR